MAEDPGWPDCPYDHHPYHRELREINERLDQIMSDFTALDTAVADLTTTVTAVQAEVASLTAAAVSDQPAITAAADTVATAVTALKGLLPAPPAPAVLASVYTFSGDPAATPIDTTQWILTAEHTTDVPPLPLYTYALDVVLGDKLGDGVGGVWHLYTGAVQ